jgi:hypothetical protein
MPSRPARLTNLTHPDAVHVINQLFAEYAKRIDDVAALASVKRLASQSVLRFGTVNAGTCAEALVNIPNASTNLVAHANPTLPLGSTNLTWTAYVFQAGQVKVRVCNPTSGNIAVNSVKWNIVIN